ncbi:MAG: hypothetical protein HY701_00110, partial [Gemmatimonadetes bacterium]|nr:hypothetical protein [Gemmatimonadota bacterium]
MSLRVAFDLDGTLADMRSALKMVEYRLFGTGAADPVLADSNKGHAPADDRAEDREAPGANPPVAEVQKEGLTLRQQRRLWEVVAGTKDFWESLNEIEPGTVRAIASQVMHRRWEVIFLTKRPATAGRTVQLQTQRWLRAKGFPLPSVFVVAGSRGKAAGALEIDAVVDDLPQNCIDVTSESRAAAVLVLRETSHRITVNAKRLGISVVPSAEEALK